MPARHRSGGNLFCLAALAMCTGQGGRDHQKSSRGPPPGRTAGAWAGVEPPALLTQVRPMLPAKATHCQARTMSTSCGPPHRHGVGRWGLHPQSWANPARQKPPPCTQAAIKLVTAMPEPAANQQFPDDVRYPASRTATAPSERAGRRTSIYNKLPSGVSRLGGHRPSDRCRKCRYCGTRRIRRMLRGRAHHRTDGASSWRNSPRSQHPKVLPRPRPGGASQRRRHANTAFLYCAAGLA
jgi:hypothetical protein